MTGSYYIKYKWIDINRLDKWIIKYICQLCCYVLLQLQLLLQHCYNSCYSLLFILLLQYWYCFTVWSAFLLPSLIVSRSADPSPGDRNLPGSVLQGAQKLLGKVGRCQRTTLTFGFWSLNKKCEFKNTKIIPQNLGKVIVTPTWRCVNSQEFAMNGRPLG